MDTFFFFFIVGILVFEYLLGIVMDFLNIKHSKKTLPEELSGIYDEEKLIKQKKYESDNFRFDLISSTFSFIVMMLMLFLGGFGYVNDIVCDYTTNPILQALIFFGVIMLASDLISTPFEIYSTFVIEERYGFNNTSIKTFILDKLKSWLLMGIIGGVLLSCIIWFILNFENSFWLLGWGTMTVFSIFFMMFYSSLIVPLFNKQTPLEEGELRDSINTFSSKVGFRLSNIFVIDGSKRSKKANAYFSGLGSKKRIVLYDTLIKDMSVQEIVAVLAHEIGHYKKKHMITNIIISIFQTGILFYVLSLFINMEALSQALGSDTHYIHLGLVAFAFIMTPLSLLLGLFFNVLSRKNEYEADNFSGTNYSADALISALKKLSANNLSNLNPHPFYVFVNYSHPTLLQRILNLKKIKN